jgi:AcrR family transcriptional regulator
MTSPAADQTVSRVDRRKLRTRTALVEAAQRIYAERGSTDVSIQQITDAADVGFGSFYNHFASKAELFDVAVTETMEAHAAWLEGLLADEDDPAAVFATSLRLTGRLVRTRPQMARVMMNSPVTMLRARQGHAPHALRDIEAAVEAGRFQVDDPVVALACTAGCLISAMQLAMMDPGTTDEQVDAIIDGAALNVLRMFRVPDRTARRLMTMPLPSEDAQAAGGREG